MSKRSSCGDQSFRPKRIVPITETQGRVFQAYSDQLNLFLYGAAGSGKTYVALYLALRDVLNQTTPYNTVYMVRSSVPSRDMGFMPGKLHEKMAVYEAPYISMLNDLFGRGDAYEIAKAKGLFQMISTSFLRGVTFENCIVILDETQNYTAGELDTAITRIGSNCRVVMCGDIEQTDLYRNKYDVSGLPEFIEVIRMMNCFEFIEFSPEDIVRGPLVKEYIIAKRDYKRKLESDLHNISDSEQP